MELQMRQETSQALDTRPALPLSDNGVRVVVVAAITVTLATFAVVLRFYARYLKKVSYGLEDWLLLSSTVMFYAYASLGILAVCIGGIGYHVKDTSFAQLEKGLKIVLALQILYAIGLGLIKCSICMMLIRIFFVRSFRIAGYLVMVFCIAWAMMTVLLAFLLCRPLNYDWNLLPTAGHCGDQRSAYAAVAIIDILTDVAILLLPQPMIWNLQLPKSSRIALMAVMCLGLFTISMSIARVVTIFDTDFKDFTYDTYDFCWPLLEYGVAILVCCGPLLRPLFEKYAPLSFRSRLKVTGGASDNATIHKPDRWGFSQLGEGEFPLQSVAAPTKITLMPGNAPHNEHPLASDNQASKESAPDLDTRGVNLPARGITVEKTWDVSDGNV